MRMALEILEEMNDLDNRKLELEAEFIAATGKTPVAYLAGMARLVEPVEGYKPGSLGDRLVKREEA